MCEASEESQSFIYEFLKIICNHYTVSLNTEELEFIKNLANKVLAIEEPNHNLSNLLKTADFSGPGGEAVKLRLSPFNESGL